jgi:gliding motility-associated-like protein
MSNNLPNIDQHLQHLLENYQANPSGAMWKKMSYGLFKKDASEFVSFKKLTKTFNSPASIGLKLKVAAAYAAAACFAVGVVFGTAVGINQLTTSTTVEKNDSVKAIEKPLTKELPVAAYTEPKEDLIPNKTSSPVKNVINHSVVPMNNVVPMNGISSHPETAVNSLPVAENSKQSLINYIQERTSDNSVKAEAKKEITSEEVQQVISELNASNANNEVESSTVEETAYKIEIPNVFTPNNDGYNDKFEIKNIEHYPVNSLVVADRNGKVVYECNGYKNDWTADNLEKGTYFYIFTYTEKSKSRSVIKGVITILR